MTDEHDNEPQASVPPTPISPKVKRELLPEERNEMMTGVQLGVVLNFFGGGFVFASIIGNSFTHSTSYNATRDFIIGIIALLVVNGLAIGLAYLARKPYFGKGWLMGFGVMAAKMLVLIGTCLWANHG